MIDIYEYTDYRFYLRDYYVETKKTTPAFSYRYFAKKTGMQSPNYLKLIVDGKRNLTEKNILLFSKALNLTPRETEYFSDLVRLNQGKTIEEKNFHTKQISKFRKAQGICTLKDEQYEVLSKWYCWVIRELTFLKDFKYDIKWITKKLGQKVTAEQVKYAIELLLKLNLIKEENGTIKATDTVLTTDKDVFGMVALYNFNQTMLRMAGEALSSQPSEKREFQTITAAVSPEKFQKAVEMIRNFADELVTFFAEEDKAENVVQINLEMFHLTETKVKK